MASCQSPSATPASIRHRGAIRLAPIANATFALWAARASCPVKYPASARIATRPEASAAAGNAARARRSRSGAVARGSSVPSPGQRPARSRSRPRSPRVASQPATPGGCTPRRASTAVHLHIGGVQADRDRSGGQRGRPLRGQQAQHPPGHHGQAGLHRPPLPGRDPAGQSRRSRGRQARHRPDQLARCISTLTIPPGLVILPRPAAPPRSRRAVPRLRSRDPAA